MEQALPAGRPMHLWIVGVLATLWNAIGALDFTATSLGATWYLKNLPPEQLAFVAKFPAWEYVVWGTGTLGAFAGSLLLLARSRLAFPVFALSLVGLVGNTAYMASAGIPVLNPIYGLIWVATVSLTFYARQQVKNGALG